MEETAACSMLVPLGFSILKQLHSVAVLSRRGAEEGDSASPHGGGPSSESDGDRWSTALKGRLAIRVELASSTIACCGAR